MRCPKCGTVAAVGDRFCEECGTPLTNTAIHNHTSAGCAKCGAASAAIDAEGFCSECGFRNRLPGSDRIEVVCLPNLGGVSDRGLRHHRNEDYLACAKVDGRNAYVIVVCDGVSSSQEPDKASSAAASSACMALTAAFEGEGEIESETAMKRALALAMETVSSIPYTTGANREPPSTTIVAAVVQNRTATIGWLGDSRAYWICEENSRQLTRDDSWLEEIVAEGKMSLAEASKSDKAHAITRWLGADAGDSEPSIVKFDIPSAGYLLLCTDGLWNYAPDAAQIADLVKESLEADAVAVARGLVEFAIAQGGHDNITVAVLSI